MADQHDSRALRHVPVIGDVQQQFSRYFSKALALNPTVKHRDQGLQVALFDLVDQQFHVDVLELHARPVPSLSPGLKQSPVRPFADNSYEPPQQRGALRPSSSALNRTCAVGGICAARRKDTERISPRRRDRKTSAYRKSVCGTR